ncbi:PREDICTED: tigger transposable element-derived protein 6-like [Rhagoletis zephyria]|uniref:tigger transposable element-derived protein 6-like n=1 Tax=Rhagoletis zephyria TaxID=28612 RepID=UPI0008113414|nr:PREDICTED: tigger transposable element-derived protein 6-like [Rhagoletis zephyria]
MCFDWFAKARSQKIPISGPILKAKAMEIAGKLGVPNFNASDGWLNKWRLRNNVSFKCISGEAADVNQDDVEQFRTKLPTLLNGYKPEDIYNADESGLFFRALPDKTLALKSEKCVGGKLSKERLTILFCANMAGDKEPLLVIGKAARPRAFKHVPIAKLPVDWKSNKKAWMTREVMSEWLQQFNRRMKAQNRKIILFLDNAASHPKELDLTNIKICFLPPNTTAVSQPLDQGIIQNFKTLYRSLVLKHLITKIGDTSSASELSKSINVLEAVYFIKASWHKVEATTIRNCFRKAGFLETLEDPSDFDPEDDIPLAVYARLQEGLDLANDFEGFLQIDQNVFTEDNNIEIQFDEPDDTMDLSDSEDEPSEEISDPITSYDEALKLVERLKQFAKNDYVAFQQVKNIESHFENENFKLKESMLKQTSITQFFQTN